jgi:hypothetical protein
MITFTFARLNDVDIKNLFQLKIATKHGRGSKMFNAIMKTYNEDLSGYANYIRSRKYFHTIEQGIIYYMNSLETKVNNEKQLIRVQKKQSENNQNRTSNTRLASNNRRTQTNSAIAVQRKKQMKQEIVNYLYYVYNMTDATKREKIINEMKIDTYDGSYAYDITKLRQKINLEVAYGNLKTKLKMWVTAPTDFAETFVNFSNSQI